MNRDLKKFYLPIGERVREARRLLRLSQDELGRLLGLDQSAVSRIETGKQELTLHHAVKAAPLLKLTLWELVG